MKKFPKIELNQFTPYAVTVAVFGFCLMQADELKNLGAILFSLGLLPLAVLIANYKD